MQEQGGERREREAREQALKQRINERWPWFRSTDRGQEIFGRWHAGKQLVDELEAMEKDLESFDKGPEAYIDQQLEHAHADFVMTAVPHLLSEQRRYASVDPSRSSIENYFKDVLDHVCRETADFVETKSESERGEWYDDDHSDERHRGLQEQLFHARETRATLRRVVNALVERLWLAYDGAAWQTASDLLHTELAAGKAVTFARLYALEEQRPELLPILLRPPYGDEPEIGKDVYGVGRGRLTFRAEGGMLVLDRQDEECVGRYLLYPPGLSREALIDMTSTYLRETGSHFVGHQAFLPEAFEHMGIRLPAYEPPRYALRYRVRLWLQNDQIHYEIFEREDEDARDEHRVQQGRLSTAVSL